MQKETSNNVAILFFSRSVEAEASAKPILPGSTRSKKSRLAESFITHTRKQIAKTNIPCISFDEEHQQGSTFGERFTHAFLSVFEQGYEHVIAVGNDTPELSAEHIKDAARTLRRGQADIVLGPASDGGTWLTAYSKDAFDARRFQQQPWQSPKLLASIMSRQKDGVHIRTLEQLADVDDYQSLVHFLAHSCHILRKLVQLLRSILAAATVFREKQIGIRTLAVPFRTVLLRAPPLR